MSENLEPATPRETDSSLFSSDACDTLGATVQRFLQTGRVPDELTQVTAQLCREAHARGLSAEATLREIRDLLGKIFASCTITSSDRAALVALAIDRCVHAFYDHSGR